MANTEHAKKAESNVKSAARLGRTAVINGIMTKINITITAATAELLNNTGADLKHRFPLPMLCIGKGGYVAALFVLCKYQLDICNAERIMAML